MNFQDLTPEEQGLVGGIADANDFNYGDPNFNIGSAIQQINQGMYENWRTNRDNLNTRARMELDALSKLDQGLVAEGQAAYIGRLMGRNQAYNDSKNNPELVQQLQTVQQQAQEAGIDPNTIINTANNAYSQSVQASNNLIANSWDAQNQGVLDRYGWAMPLAFAVAAPAAAGAFGAEAGATGLGAAGGTGLTGGAGGSTGLLAGGSVGGGLTIPTGAAIAIDPAIAAGAGAGLGGGAAIGAGLSGTSGLSAALPSAGSVGGAGAGLSAELAPGATLGTGLNGGAIGGSYLAGANGMVATDALGNAIPASSVGMGGVNSTASGLSASDILNNANRIKNIGQLLSAGSSATKPTATTSNLDLSKLASLLNPKAQTNDFLGQYKMNQNPFTFTSPGQTVASEGMYDVSGYNPMANALRKVL